MSEVLRTQEVGSLAKPNWRVQPFINNEITDQHIADAYSWARRLDIDQAHPREVLLGAREHLAEYGHLDETNGEEIKLLAALYAIRLQEKAGLDIIYDGEQDRPEMYQVAVEGTQGFEWRGRVRAFDNKSYQKAAVVGDPAVKEPWHVAEFKRLRYLTIFTEKKDIKDVKVPITGAFTIAAWSYDERYGGNFEQFVLDLARNVIKPNIKALLEAGAEWIQIDEPAAATFKDPDKLRLFVDSFNESVADLVGKFSTHICFSDYSLLFPHVAELENCSQFSIELANHDSQVPGTKAIDRPALEILKDFKRYTPDIAIGLGVSSVHDSRVESVDLVRDRVLRAVEIIGDPALVYPSPDCGLRVRSWDNAYQKLQAVVEGTNLAREKLE